MVQDSIQYNDLNDVEWEIKSILALFEQKESEDNWTLFDDALTRFTAVARGSWHINGFVGSVRKIKQPILSSLSTERTKLARTALMLVEVLSKSLRERFEGLADFILPAVLRLCTRANKVFVNSASATLKCVIDNSGVPAIAPLLNDSLQSPSKTLRIAAAECIFRIMEVNPIARLEPYTESLEAAIKSSTVDSTSEVRNLARQTFDLYKDMFPTRIDRFLLSLSDTAAKYLKVTKPSAIPRKTPVMSSRIKPSPSPSQHNSNLTSPSKHKTSAQLLSDDDLLSLEYETPSFDVDSSDISTHARSVSVGSVGRPKLLADLFHDESRTKPRPQSLALNTRSHHDVNNSTHSQHHPVPPPMKRSLTEKTLSRGNLSAEVSGVRMERSGTVGSHYRTNSTSTVNSLLPPRPKPITSRILGAAAPSAESTSGPIHTNGIPLAKRQQSKSSALASGASSSASKRTSSISAVSSASSRLSRQSNYSITDNHLDFVDLMNKMKSSDWSTRLRAIESVNSYISAASSPAALPTFSAEVRGKITKLSEVYVMGLGDNHSKCLSVTLDGLGTLMMIIETPDLLEAFIPRMAGLVYYQSHKVKPQILEASRGVIQTARDKFGVELIGLAAVQGLYNPEFAKGLKVRTGCLGLLADLTEDELHMIASKPIRKLLTAS
jgi:hypothetical protein